MEQRSHVPKFGDWGSEENVPYTAYFDKARKDKSGMKMINPNDPQQNPDAFSEEMPPVRAPPFRTIDSEAPVAAPTSRRGNREENELRPQTDSPGRHDSPAGRKMTSESPLHRHGGRRNSGDSNRGRENGGHERSIEQSPLHPHHQAKAAGRGGVSSPSWERKGSSEGGHSATPGRSRLKPRGDETPDRSAAVPKFGDWNEDDPASADGFTGIFNQVRVEKQTGAVKIPAMPTSYPNGHKEGNSQDTCCGCFPSRRR